MHVALFSPAWPLEHHHNGIVTYVHWMRHELEAMGHRVSVFTGLFDGSPGDAGVHPVRDPVGSRWARRLRRAIGLSDPALFDWGGVLAASILAVHRRTPIDVIEMEESFGWSAEVERRTRLPVLVKLHGPAFLSLIEEELATPMGRERVHREGLALAQASALAAPAALTLSQTVERYGLRPAIAEHVVNPLSPVDEAQCWTPDGCDPDTILFVGRFDRRKGADLVLQAFKRLLRERPALKLVVVGPDAGLLRPDGSRVHFAAFRDSLFGAAEAGRIDFRGRLPNADIGALRCAARVTVVASRWENQGYTALEAMAQGCPVVASAVGGNPESVLHGETGRLFRVNDADDLAEQLAWMLDHPDDAARLGAAARRHVLVHHATSTVARQSLDLYRRVIERRRSR